MIVQMAAAPASRYQTISIDGVPAKIDARFWPPRAGSGLTAADVTRVLGQAVRRSAGTRAAMRPGNVPAQINITVVDTEGVVLGIASTRDAPEFGFDVSAQKARTAAFFSRPDAGARLRAAGQAGYADAAAADGVMLNGTIAFSGRAIAFLSRPFFPDGQDGTANGPFSKPINVWSPFNNGLQLALIRSALVKGMTGAPMSRCTSLPGVGNGMQISAGGVPLYRNGVLVGAVGASGDGIDQDDFVAAAGSVGFDVPPNLSADRFTVRGIRLPVPSPTEVN